MVKKSNRYKDCYIIRRHKDDGGYIHLSTYRKRKIINRTTDIYHTVVINDTLDKLAYMYYQDEKLWWVIAEYNNLSFPFELEVGKTLILPDYNTVVNKILV